MDAFCRPQEPACCRKFVGGSFENYDILAFEFYRSLQKKFLSLKALPNYE